MPRGKSTFTKRQKEQKRQERQREKDARRSERKLEKTELGALDMEELRRNAEEQAALFNIGGEEPAV